MIRKFFYLMISLFCCGNLIGQNIELSDQLIEQYYSGREGNPSKSLSCSASHLWLTPLIHKAVIHWDELTDEAQRLFLSYRNRPTFNGEKSVFIAGNFAIHYTTKSVYPGENVPEDDDNNNDIPDYIEIMADVLLTVYNDYHKESGYAIPPNDFQHIDGAYYDVYVNGLSAGDGIYGYVSPEFKVGDNPNTTEHEEYAYSSFMVLRNNYIGYGDGDFHNALKVTVAHEYMHSVQFGYTARMGAWFMEMTATWAEDYMYPQIKDNFQYFPAVFLRPDVALDIENGASSTVFDNHWYSMWIFAKYLTEQTSNQVIQKLYRRIVTGNYVDALTEELEQNWDISFRTFFKNYIVANLLLSDDNEAYSPYVYKNALDYRQYINSHGVRLNFENALSPFNFGGEEINWNSNIDGNGRLMRFSADYFIMKPILPFTLQIDQLSDGADIDLFLVKKASDNIVVQATDKNGEINVGDLYLWEEFYPIIVRYDPWKDIEDDCNYVLKIFEYELEDDQQKQGVLRSHLINENKLYFLPHNVPYKSIELFDIQGKSIFREKNFMGRYVSLPHLSDGIYVFVAYNDKNMRISEKIVVIQ